MFTARQGMRLAINRRSIPIVGQRSFVSSASVLNTKNGGPATPINDERTSPKTSTGNHPGYTDASTPVTDAHPSNIPPASANQTPVTQARLASTKHDQEHPGVFEMAEGAKVGGEGAEKPEDRNVKGWGPNNLSSQFSQHEGRRNPVLDGGSHEGGHDSKGNSKT